MRRSGVQFLFPAPQPIENIEKIKKIALDSCIYFAIQLAYESAENKTTHSTS